MDKWVWDVDKKRKVRQSWLDKAIFWDILIGDGHCARATDGNDRVIMFRGTESECEDYIDRHTD